MSSEATTINITTLAKELEYAAKNTWSLCEHEEAQALNLVQRLLAEVKRADNTHGDPRRPMTPSGEIEFLRGSASAPRHAAFKPPVCWGSAFGHHTRDGWELQWVVDLGGEDNWRSCHVTMQEWPDMVALIERGPVEAALAVDRAMEAASREIGATLVSVRY